MIEEEYSVLGTASGLLKLNHETKGWIRIAPCILQFLDVSKGFVLRATHAKNVLLHSPVSSLQFMAVSNTTHEFILPDMKQYRMEYEKVTDASNFSTLLGNATHEQRKSAGGMATEMASRQPQQVEKGELIDSLINDFMISVNNGDVGNAGKIAQKLASHKVPLAVSQDTGTTSISKNDGTISLRISVEDRFDSAAKITLNVKPSISFKTLKDKMYNLYGFPPRVQRWIVGHRIVKDHETLKSLNIETSGFMIFLYLVSAKTADIKKDEGERRPAENAEVTVDNLSSGEVPLASGVSQARANHPPPPPGRPPAKVPMEEVLRFIGAQGFSEKASAVTSSAPGSGKKTAIDVGWHCEGCTMVNAPRRPSCHMCSKSRPDNYVMPPVGSYELDAVEKRLLEEEKKHEDVMRQGPGDLRGPGLLREGGDGLGPGLLREGGDGLRLETTEPQPLVSFQQSENSF